MTTTETPEIGQSALANGIRTNYLEDGKAGDDTRPSCSCTARAPASRRTRTGGW